ncbi:glycosyltransferase family 2 protein, partial [Streptomyces nodosus]
MPRFSIIVPASGVAGRLSQALDSVLTQSFGDFELIPVCDAPGSPAGAVAAGYAERDHRVVPMTSPSSGGPGVARTTPEVPQRGHQVAESHPSGRTRVARRRNRVLLQC